MQTYIPANLIKEKIFALQSALFINDSEAVLKIPNQIISAAHVDELGQVWFTIPPPFQSMFHFDNAFPAQLDFFKKETSFFLKITGNAFVINDPEELNNLLFINEKTKQQIRNGKLVLVKLKMQRSEYFEKDSPDADYTLPKIKSKIYKWMNHQQTQTNERVSKKLSWQNLVHVPNIFSN